MRWWRRSEENPQEQGERRARRRLAGFIVLMALWGAAILFRLVQLQVFAHAEYRTQADRQQQHTFVIEAARGAILDRSGHPLALSVASDSVCVNPQKINDPQLAAEMLARWLSLDPAELTARLVAAKKRNSGFLWVKRKISPSESERLRSLNFDWVEFRQESQRYYPDGSLATHVVGSVDFEEKGNQGVEKHLNQELGGRAGKVRMLTDVRQRGIEALESVAPQPGATITLSLDERIQLVAEREIKAACELRQATGGSIVVMNPYNGEILALASYPPLPRMGKDSENRDARAATPVLPGAQWNHPVSVPFEPGSVFKIITLTAALETTNLRPESPINTGNGSINLFGRVIHESHGRGLGVVPMSVVLARSSNIGAIQIGLKVGEKNLHEYVKRFGFGQRTGVPLPAESRGTVYELNRWTKSSIGSVAIGHEVTATALQLARACSVIANGGVLVGPRLVLKVQQPGAKAEVPPVEAPKRIIKAETAITMRRMMEGVVLPGGSGTTARLPGYTSGGKTGTAQLFDWKTRKYSHLYNGSFVGFAPATNPAVVVAVTLNGSREYGGIVAAPVFKTVTLETLRLLDVPRDLPETALPDPPAKPEQFNDVALAMSEPPADALGADLPAAETAAPLPASAPAPQQATKIVVAGGPQVPSFQGKTVRAVLQESLAAGVPVDVIGNGLARAQAPAPGRYLNPGERVRVQFR